MEEFTPDYSAFDDSNWSEADKERFREELRLYLMGFQKFLVLNGVQHPFEDLFDG